MSRRRSRLRAQHSSPNTLQKPHLRLVTAEPAEVREAAHGATVVTTDACLDDRATVSPSLGLTLAGPPTDLPGAVLRRHREAHGLTVDDLVRATKISKNTLRAIEATDTAHLPPAVYTRGFVKAYAREVGLDPNAAAADYFAAIEPVAHPAPAHDDARAAAGAAANVDRGAEAIAEPRATPNVPREGAPAVTLRVSRNLTFANSSARHLLTRTGRLLTIAALAAFVVYVWSINARDEGASTTNTDEPAVLGDATPASGPVGGPTPDAAAAIADGPLHLELTTRGLCWVSAVVDGEPVLAKLLQPGERHVLQVGEEVVLRIGEPGALSVSINGQATSRIGTPGQPLTVRITKDNFHGLLSS